MNSRPGRDLLVIYIQLHPVLMLIKDMPKESTITIPSLLSLIMTLRFPFSSLPCLAF